MRLRFEAQLNALREERPLDNSIVLSKLGNMDEAMLKQAFLQIESLQRKVGYDFWAAPNNRGISPFYNKAPDSPQLKAGTMNRS